MITIEYLRKLTDFILLNAYSVSSTGLYNGKAGMSLCLFEVARATEDEQLEEHAFELLQEALLSKNTDVDFENGLSGIGFVFRYLIDKEFIDADFEEMFGEQTQKILDELEKRKPKSLQLLVSIKMIYFLSDLNRVKPNVKVFGAMRSIFEAVELYLSIQFSDFKAINYRNNKQDVMTLFEDYLRLVSYARYTDFLPSLLTVYAELYRQGKIASSLIVACYLDKICSNNSIFEFNDVISNNKGYGLKNTKLELLSLHQCAELYQLLKTNHDVDHKIMDTFEMALFGKEGSDFEQSILKMIPKNTFLAGYGDGVARLLMLSTNLVAPLC
jgi:hypothetical protein